MGDDFGTVSVRRAERAREIEILRQHYREHRDSLASLADNAPTDFLATEYQRLVSEIDAAIAKLEELEAGHPGGDPHEKPKTLPGTRPIVHSPGIAADAAGPRTYVSSAAPSTGSRMIVMVVVGLVVLGLIGYLIWRAGGDRRKPVTPVAEQPAVTQPAFDTAADTTIAPVTPAPVQPPAATGTAVPAEVANSVMITPALADYGTVRRGTRATRQFQVINTTTAPVSIKVSRSECRCLYYEYTDRLAPKKKESITVTIDGARAKPGILQETIQISGKSGTPLAQFQVQATVK